MIIIFELTSNFNIKLKYNLLKKANKILDYGNYILFLRIIEYLII